MNIYKKIVKKMDWKKFRKYMNIKEYEELAMKNGTEWKTSCLMPDHDEKTPSFYLNIDLGLFRCFGCDEKSNLVVLISKVKGVSTKEAFDKLKELSGISEDSFSVEEVKGKIQLLEEAKDELKEENEVQIDKLPKGVELTKQCLKFLSDRGIKPEISSKFGLYFADLGYYHSTIILPIKDLNGEHRTFESRQIVKGIEPKVRYPKRSNVHELIFNYKESRKYNYGILVEGLMDCLSLIGRTFPNTMTGFGTSFCNEQLKAFSKFDKIVVLFDPDRAGKKASNDILQQLSSVTNVLVGKLKKDPKYCSISEIRNAIGNAYKIKDKSTNIVKGYISDLMES